MTTLKVPDSLFSVWLSNKTIHQHKKQWMLRKSNINHYFTETLIRRKEELTGLWVHDHHFNKFTYFSFNRADKKTNINKIWQRGREGHVEHYFKFIAIIRWIFHYNFFLPIIYFFVSFFSFWVSIRIGYLSYLHQSYNLLL